jgi:hypothetical protein
MIAGPRGSSLRAQGLGVKVLIPRRDDLHARAIGMDADRVERTRFRVVVFAYSASMQSEPVLL